MKSIDFITRDTSAVAGRFRVVVTIIFLITAFLLILGLVLYLTGLGTWKYIAVIFSVNCAVYPVFYVFVKKERIQLAVIYIWIVLHLLELAIFVNMQQGIFTHVEVGYAILIFISGFLLPGYHVLIIAGLSCVSYLVPGILFHIGNPMVFNFFGLPRISVSTGRIIAVSLTNSITFLIIGVMVYWIMKKFDEWNTNLVSSRDQLMRAEKIAHTGSWEYDVKTKQCSVSQEFLLVFGTDDSAFDGDLAGLLGDRLYPDDRDRVINLFFGPPENSKEKECGEFKIVVNSEKLVYISAEAEYRYDQTGELTGSSGIVQDISERKMMEEQLMHLAHYDELTGLANRVLFYDRINQALSRSKRERTHFVLLYIDLDGFKAVNDNFGHDAGDKLLKALADKIRSPLRDSDTVARMGGDEFAVIIPDIRKLENSSIAADKVLASLRETAIIDGNEFTLSASIGIAVYPDDSTEVDELIKMADIAMYQAKQKGKNRFCYYS